MVPDLWSCIYDSASPKMLRGHWGFLISHNDLTKPPSYPAEVLNLCLSSKEPVYHKKVVASLKANVARQIRQGKVRFSTGEEFVAVNLGMPLPLLKSHMIAYHAYSTQGNPIPLDRPFIHRIENILRSPIYDLAPFVPALFDI